MIEGVKLPTQSVTWANIRPSIINDLATRVTFYGYVYTPTITRVLSRNLNCNLHTRVDYAG